MTKNYTDAATAYQTAYVNNMSGFDIVVELYKGIIKHVEHAKKSYADGRLDEMCNFIQKANKILIALQAHLDFNKGGDAALFLNEFYNGIFTSLAQVLRKSNPEEEFENILENILPVYRIWVKHVDDLSPAST